jgi:predicted transcriptional regulator
MIYTYVKENPGIQTADLNKLTGFTYRNLIYHLNHLVNTGMITSGECKNTTRYFENSGKYSPEERTMLMYLNHRRDKKIIETVFRNPGISRSEISRHVGISGPTVSWHIHFLLNDNIIEQEKEGTVVRHYLSDKMLKVYDNLSSRVSMPA